ncbi:ParA family protein [Paraburkholderia tropica]|uniref:ParA family protein n=1 Tax=Paraburkholderia tropica TaxID=92647 RepID=UPI002AB60025|nr:ParA family protein [Paraburkholderia tropica]
MPTVISVVSTKGGVGKTTTAANLGGILADFGMQVLLVDADVQPSLSKYFELPHRAPNGLSSVIRSGGSILDDAISQTNIPNLHVVCSDAPDGSLQTWLRDREDRLMILRRAVRNSPAIDKYNVVIIDTQGAVGELQKTAAMAAHIMLSPIKPDLLSAGEFASGTLNMLTELNRLADYGEAFRAGELYALVNDCERTNNSREFAAYIRRQFAGHKNVRVLNTQVPHAAAWPTATTQQIPVHQYERRQKNSRSTGAPWTTMHQLVWELFPELDELYIDDFAHEDSAAKEVREEGGLA